MPEIYYPSACDYVVTEMSITIDIISNYPLMSTVLVSHRGNTL